MVCVAGRELPLVFLWRCDTSLVIHMDFKKNLHTRCLVYLSRLQIFSSEIVSTYLGCSIKNSGRFFLSILRVTIFFVPM